MACCRASGAIWGTAEKIVWWHFVDNGEIGQRAIRDLDELEALKQAGSPLDEPALELRRIASAWERPLQHVGQKLLLVLSAMAGGEEVKTHPLWHSLVAGRSRLAERIGARAETILRDVRPQLAGRDLSREKVEPAVLPGRRAEWSAAADAIDAREFESASSLSSLLSCPLKWTLHYVSNLESGVRQSLAGGDQLFGTLAHKIAEGLFKPGAPPPRRRARPRGGAQSDPGGARRAGPVPSGQQAHRGRDGARLQRSWNPWFEQMVTLGGTTPR